MNRGLTVLALGLAFTGCKKSDSPAIEAKAPPPKAISLDAPDAAPPPPQTTATPTDAVTGGNAAPGDPSLPLTDEQKATSEEIARFNPPEPMNAYAKRGPGDYQAQLDLYNKVLRTWAANVDTPATFKDLMATYNSPKPPEPPAGRKLVYDRRTISVRLE